jgi:hypothetical protein
MEFELTVNRSKVPRIVRNQREVIIDAPFGNERVTPLP